MRLCADQPDAREGLRDGSLTLSAAAELQWAFDRQRRRGSISGTAGSHRQARASGGVGGTERSGARLRTGRTVAPRRAASMPPLVLDAVGRQDLVEEAAGNRARQVR